MAISINGMATSFPRNIIDNSYFGEEVQNTNNPMFFGTEKRRHISRDQMASDLIAEAIYKLRDQSSKSDSLNRVGLLMTNVAVPDELFTGCGAVVAKKAQLDADHILDLHNTGCVSFLFMMELADKLLEAYDLDDAIICNVQTAGGRIFSQSETRRKAQAAIPGDGCGIAYITRGNDGDGASVVCSELSNFRDYSEDMFGTFDDGRKYWEPGESAGYIDFNEAKVAKVISRGNKLVPKMVENVCRNVGVDSQALDWLITNQPNLHFLRNWREALQLPDEKHLHTFGDYANLFGAGIPITMAENMAKGRFKKGDLICLAGFSHAGDYAGASLIRW